MNTPTSKRRRIESANATLRRPFRSPLVRGRSNAPVQVPDPATTPERETTPHKERVLSGAKRARSSETRSQGSGRCRARDAGTEEVPRFSWRERRHEMEDENRRIEQEISRLENLDPASKVMSDKESPDDELDGLIEKWKGAAQQAAEELFEASRLRVQSMGGLGGMKKRRAEYRDEYGLDKPSTSKENPDRDLESFSETEDGNRQEETGKEDENQEYTMEAMLRSLNIDFKVIGYNETEETWT